MSKPLPLPKNTAKLRNSGLMSGISSSPSRVAGAVAMLTLALSGCPASKVPNPTGSAAPPGTAVVESPNFKEAPLETVEALKLVGFEHVYAYIWKGGRLGGFVQFDGPRKLDIDSMVDGAMSTLDVMAKTDGATLDASRTRGLVLFAVSPLKPPSTVRECLFGLKIYGETKDGKNMFSVTNKDKGTIPNFGVYSAGRGTFFIELPDRRTQQVFEFRLVATNPPGLPEQRAK